MGSRHFFAQFALQGKLSHQFDFRDSSFSFISDTFTFVGYKQYKVSVIQAILFYIYYFKKYVDSPLDSPGWSSGPFGNINLKDKIKGKG